MFAYSYIIKGCYEMVKKADLRVVSDIVNSLSDDPHYRVELFASMLLAYMVDCGVNYVNVELANVAKIAATVDPIGE
jgi:hypothetical protein